MSTISKLQERLAEASRMLGELEGKTRADPDDFVARLTLENFRGHVEELELQLHRAKKSRAVEVIQVRLTGRLAETGSLPLYLLSQLADQFADALHASSQRLKTGRRVGRISPAVVQELNLRLADLAPGSTRLFITGDTQPDLFGYSLLENSLENTFELFDAADEGELATAVGVVGIRSAKEIRDFLSTIKKAELEIEISWIAPDARARQWSGDYQRISRLSRSLSHFEVREPSYVEIRGEVVTVSARGRFEIFAEGRMYQGTFPADLLRDMAALHIGEEVVAVLERTVVVNTVTNVEKTDYSLIRVTGTGQARFGEEI